MQMHFYMSESFQLERLYVTNLLHRFSVNVCTEGTIEESNELPVPSLFACIMATLNRNFTGCNWGPMDGNMAASDRGPGSQEVGQELWLVEKSLECKIWGNKFSLVCERLGKYHPDLCVVIELWCRGAFPVAQDEQKRRRERRLNRENQTCMSSIVYVYQVCLVLKRYKSCKCICSFLRRIRVLKDGRSALY